MRNKIYDIISIVAKKPVAEIIESSDNKGLWDSFTHLELILALEEEFNIMFEPEEISEMLTPELVIRGVGDKLNNES
ncbi:hypothetical protein OGV37_25320 [Citrobacter sp. Cb010]|jgi:acyl carrier protein|uniref:acyl carrier protein n=1 Tax=unclassified Citrobacter TaxID=2644389 RepID=UPI0011EFFDAA|nr:MULTISPECIES: acyl carrier protein [unclassified Citrobacter]KAA0554808.1 acyl carrier protein [Citrobacter braakii]MDM3378166.1 hypothetical protein [Citrobacter sp. Cb010]MDM3407548.1 hypothetical protein [Citrobacter sp. Cb022]MDM3458242.1 hypothetical protein [Citrobacter sp. Cb036]